MSSREMKKGSAGVCGPGIYFATSPKMTKGKAHHFGYMIEARIYVGRRLFVDRQDLSLNGDKVRHQGYDSVHCVRDKIRWWKDEYIIYSWDRATIIAMYPCDPYGKPRAVQLVKPKLIPKDPVPSPQPQKVVTPAAAPKPAVDPAPQKAADPAQASAPAAEPAPALGTKTQLAGNVRVFDSCLKSPIFLDAITHSYKTHLQHRYKEGDNKLEHGGITVWRANHGLAHTIRVASYLPVVVSAVGIKLSQAEVHKAQVALCFFVTGRESETSFRGDKAAYKRFRDASAANYLAYAQGKGIPPSSHPSASAFRSKLASKSVCETVLPHL